MERAYGETQAANQRDEIVSHGSGEPGRALRFARFGLVRNRADDWRYRFIECRGAGANGCGIKYRDCGLYPCCPPGWPALIRQKFSPIPPIDFSRNSEMKPPRRLLSRGTEDAKAFLRNTLISPVTPNQFAVANALARDPAPDPMFVDPLFALITNRDLAIQASRALAGYKSTPGVLTHLLDLAARRATARRNFLGVAVIHAIGTMLQKRAAAATDRSC